MSTKAIIALTIVTLSLVILWVVIPPVGFAMLVLSFFTLCGIAWKRGVI